LGARLFHFETPNPSPASQAMKTLLPLLIVTTTALVGCGQKKEEAPAPSSPSSGNPVTAPVDYLGAVTKAKKSMEGKIDTVAVTQAIQQFAGEKGRLPKDLNELVGAGYLKSLPQPPYGMKLQYNAQAGEVKVVPAQ
jgi:hypothetical protein